MNIADAESTAKATPSENLRDFAGHYDFSFDSFQVQACGSIDAGHGVLVAAPTGSGKTVIGEYACFLAVREHSRCFYTTPIKALSNQKYHDLVAAHGADNVGLLTGDVTINGDAPIVVMTTEVLRNMLYAVSPDLETLSYVVLDEVHYLSDRFRGAVWEEVILGLAESVQVVALSATVSNAEEFGDWLDTVRGNVDIVVWEKRPVPLYQHVMADHEIYDLFGSDGRSVNPKLTALARQESRTTRDDSRRPRGRNGRGKRRVTYGSGQFGGASSSRVGDRRHQSHGLTPSRAMVVTALQKAGLVPAIYFVFSRQGCDAAVRQLLRSGVRLTDRTERAQLRELAQREGASLSETDRAALGWNDFVEALSRGIAAHHAGLLPVFKAIVEEGFTRGWLKVVFATETLALGINMPARTVVLERLVKYNGETHADITPGEYTQLTGRAGRRGIDTEGHAVVLWQTGMDPRAVAGLASKRTYPLRSSFAPNYNMAVNLVRSAGRDRARSLLEQSFAQFQADRKVVAAARQGVAVAGQIADAWQQAHCSRGDFASYARLRDEVRELEREQARLRKQDQRAAVLDGLSRLEPGDVIHLDAGKRSGWLVVIEPARPGKPEPHPLVMGEDHQIVRIAPEQFKSAPVTAAKVRVPKRFDRHSAAARKALSRALDARIEGLSVEAGRSRAPLDAELSHQISELRARLRAHPCHDCPHREDHARAAERALRLERENNVTQRRAADRRNSIAAQFDRICAVLDALGYLDPSHPDEVTPAGTMLTRIYSELDLVVAQAIREKVFAELNGPQLAAVLSTMVYEARATDTGGHRMPDDTSARALRALRSVWREVGLVERDHRVERQRDLDIGFADAAAQWASGASLADILGEFGLTAGDFVRWTRQVVDLASQISAAPGLAELGSPGLARTCRAVIGLLRRDIVDFETAEPE
ncbi:DEAD/DEAH box helicase [Propionibacterium freudenreichii]|uniref:DEAD/DEAH box helicase n=1 Tax=Propionibacterium freudenreichii TaxID=1744 RepID=UPI000BC32870|nr:DSH domain protein [Propionibacterium freudenreichii]